MRISLSSDRDSRRVTFWVVAALYFGLAWRWLSWVHRFAVNVLYLDQWDFYRSFFNGEGWWGIFSFEHAPHRQGLGAILVRLLAALTSWNTRGDSFLVAGCLLAAALAAFPLARRCGLRGLALAGIPLLFCNVHQYETWVGPANPSHGALPVLLLVAYAHVWFVRRRGARLILSSGLAFLGIFTGFGIFIGVLQPLLLAVEFRDARRQRPLPVPVLGAGAALAASWLLFFHGYHFDPAVPGFRFPWHPLWHYGEFIARMGGTFVGIPDAAWSMVAGTVLFAGMAAVAIAAAWRLARGGIEGNPVAAALFTLAGFTLIYAANTAVGRVSLGPDAASAGRYVTLLIPGALSVLLGLGAWRRFRWHAAAAVLFTAALVPATAYLRPGEHDDIHHYADGKQAWKNAYLQTGDAGQADALSGFPIYPAPLLGERLQFLRDHRLNLFHRPVSADAILKGDFAPTSLDIDSDADPALVRDRRLWDSRDRNGTGMGRLECGPFVAGPAIEIWVAGYPIDPGEALYLEKADGSAQLPLLLRFNPGPQWCSFRWNVPAAWRGIPVKLVAEDFSKESGRWLGVSEPEPPAAGWFEAISLALRQLLVAVSLLLPGLAAACLLRRRAVLGVLASVVVASAVTAHLLVYVYLKNPAAGRLATGGLAAVSLAIVLWRRDELARRCRQLDFTAPLLLSLLAAVVYSSAGFAYGGARAADAVGEHRFGWVLPIDAELPWWFADRLASGAPLRPFTGDWLTSDRPPLQTGLNLAAWDWTDDSLGHALVGIAAQSWFWIGLWIFMRSLGISRRGQALAVAAALLSGLLFVNSFYSWPKLLPAAFVLICAGFLFGAETGLAASAALPLVAAAAACAMLAHGGSAIAFIAFALVYAARRRWAPWRVLAGSALLFEALLLPWQLYQHFVDPPGDRLLKYHLAGHPAIDPRPTWAVVHEAYHRLPWNAIWRAKLQNAGTLFWGNAGWLNAVRESVRSAAAGHPGEAWRHFALNTRIGEFFHCIEALGPFLIALIVAVIGWLRRKPGPRRAGGIVGILIVATCAVWCLIMFVGGATVIHQGTLFINASLLVLAGVGLAEMPGRLAAALLAFAAAWFGSVWLVATTRGYPTFHGWMPSSYPAFWFVAAAGAILLAALLRRVARAADPPVPLG